MASRMEISFKSKKLKKVIEDEKALQRNYGERMARSIMMRMGVLHAASTLAEVPIDRPDRCHQLTKDRDEEFAVDLVHPKRLVFEVDYDPISRKGDGGIDKEGATAITIIEIVDYH